MVDLISSRAIDITKLALDGLMERQRAISSNTANVMTPNYVRQQVSFEGQLQNMIDNDDVKESLKMGNSLQYTPSARDLALGNISETENRKIELTPQQKAYLQTGLYSNYSPEVSDDTSSGTYENGNNVNMEQEVMDMAKTGTQYNVLSNLEQRSIQNIASAIKGGS
jgi:flagellar basal body rod protein FlgB